MEDYLTEADQWEALKRWLKENGAWIIGGVLLGAGGLLGWRWWQAHVTDRSQAAATQFVELETALGENQNQKVQELAAVMQEEHAGTPYADQAQLALARVYVENGQLDQAAERLRSVMSGSKDNFLRQLARLRLAQVELAQGKPDAALATLAAAEPGAFAAAYNEVRGDALLAKGDQAAAVDAYRAALLEVGGGGADSAQLQLKINELAAPLAAPADKPKTESAPK